MEMAKNVARWPAGLGSSVHFAVRNLIINLAKGQKQVPIQCTENHTETETKKMGPTLLT